MPWTALFQPCPAKAGLPTRSKGIVRGRPYFVSTLPGEGRASYSSVSIADRTVDLWVSTLPGEGRASYVLCQAALGTHVSTLPGEGRASYPPRTRHFLILRVSTLPGEGRASYLA